MNYSRFENAASVLRGVAHTSDPGRAMQGMLQTLGEIIQAAAQLEHDHEQLKLAFEQYRDEASKKIDQLQDKVGIAK